MSDNRNPVKKLADEIVFQYDRMIRQYKRKVRSAYRKISDEELDNNHDIFDDSEGGE